MIDFNDAIRRSLQENNDEHSHTELDPFTFHASQLAKCPRQCYASKLGLLDTSDALGTFHTGTTIHEYMEAEVAPRLSVETQREVPIEMDIDGLHIVGHADLYEPATNTVYDYKSRANWYKFSPPIQRHLDQVYVYMKALGASQGQIVYLSKADLEVRTWPPQSAGVETFAFEPGRFQDLVEKGQQIAATIIDRGYPTCEDEIPFEKDDCWFCSKESLQFDHLDTKIDPSLDLGLIDASPGDADDGRTTSTPTAADGGEQQPTEDGNEESASTSTAST